MLRHVALLLCRHHNPNLSSFITYHVVCSKSNITGATNETETAYPSITPDSVPGF